MENFLTTLAEINDKINAFIWVKIGLVLLIGTGILMTCCTKWFQISHIGYWWQQTIGGMFRRDSGVHAKTDKKTISQFQALCTALAATIGTGNIAGVSAAIVIGGPGAVFWMWVAAFFGMMTNFSENVLGIYYRRRNSQGEWSGGAMYYLKDGLGGKKQLTDKQTIFYTRACNVLSAVVAMLISLFGVSIVAMNTFAFGIRCAGPFAAYGLGLAVPKATKNSGIISIICGTIAFVVWQIVGGGGTWMLLMPVVAGCLVSTISFFVVNWIEWGRGVAPAPSAYLTDEEVARKIAEESAGR